MTVREMRKKENEYKDFMDCRDCEISIYYPGVSMTFTHLELARYFIEGILNDMFFNGTHGVMEIVSKEGGVIADISLNYLYGAEKVGAGLYCINSEKLDFNHCLDRIFELIDDQEVA